MAVYRVRVVQERVAYVNAKSKFEAENNVNREHPNFDSMDETLTNLEGYDYVVESIDKVAD